MVRGKLSDRNPCKLLLLLYDVNFAGVMGRIFRYYDVTELLCTELGYIGDIRVRHVSLSWQRRRALPVFRPTAVWSPCRVQIRAQ